MGRIKNFKSFINEAVDPEFEITPDFKKIEKREWYQEFIDWFKDGSAIKFSDGYSNQETQWRGRWKTIESFYDWFEKEYYSDYM